MARIDLSPLCEGRKYIGVDRDIKDVDRVWGVALAVSTKLLLLARCVDFHLDGYVIIRRNDIARICCGRSERVFERILKNEGILENVTAPAYLELESWPTVFRSLRTMRRMAIVEGEDPELDEFIIGRIERIGKKSVRLRHFSVTGYWEDKPSVAPYEDITLVSFDSEYISVFGRYVRERKAR